MFESIQAQTSGIIFLFVLSIAAPIAGAVLLTTRMIVKRYLDIPFSAIVPAVLSTGLITSLLLGFVFPRAWESFDVASKSLNQEVICGGPLLPDCGEDSHRNSRGVIGFELVGRPVSERLVDSL
jgi:hypothetical protein